jgi:hypothetical protein
MAPAGAGAILNAKAGEGGNAKLTVESSWDRTRDHQQRLHTRSGMDRDAVADC